MPTSVIRPTGGVFPYVTPTGATLPTAINDQSDATYVRQAEAVVPMMQPFLPQPTCPAGSDIATLMPGMRLAQATSGPVRIAIGVIGGQPAAQRMHQYVSCTALALGNFNGSGSATKPDGTVWGVDSGTIVVAVDDQHVKGDVNRAYIYEVFGTIYYAARPAVAIAVSPASPITTTSRPTLNASITALVEAWQSKTTGWLWNSRVCGYEVRLFNAAQYGAVGFDPAASACVMEWDGATDMPYVDGVAQTTSNIALTPSSALANDTYRAYIRARRQIAGGGYCAWAYQEFIVNFPVPPAPTVVVTGVEQHAEIAVTPVSGTGMSNPLIYLERSADAGATWTPVRGGTGYAGTFGTATTFYDYEAPRGIALYYRARCEVTYSGQQLVTAWIWGGYPVISAIGWNLKAVLAATLNMNNVAVFKDPKFTVSEDTSVIKPIGRTYPVVTSLRIGGLDGAMTLAARSTAERGKLQALLNYQGVLLMESPFGWSRYIRIIGDRSITEGGTPGKPRYTAEVSFVEVGSA